MANELQLQGAPAPAAPGGALDLNAAAAPAPVAPEATAAPAAPAIPPEIEMNPIIQAVAMGEPAAIFATKDSKSPTVELIAAAGPSLPQMGLALYGSKKYGVLFNPELVTPDEVARAVRSGDLKKIAVDIDQFEDAIDQIINEGAPAEGAPAGPAGVAPVAGPSGTTKRVNAKRAQNLKPLSPTGGANPGQGLINELTKPVI